MFLREPTLRWIEIPFLQAFPIPVSHLAFELKGRVL
jgi:hypothetical protein